jgi:hypothetical protein
MSCTLQEPTPATISTGKRGPYKKRRKPCIVCGKPSAGVTSYVYLANGRNQIGVPFCKEHMDNQHRYAQPVFQNTDALVRFRKEHPGLYSRYVEGKIILFIDQRNAEAEA